MKTVTLILLIRSRTRYNGKRCCSESKWTSCHGLPATAAQRHVVGTTVVTTTATTATCSKSVSKSFLNPHPRTRIHTSATTAAPTSAAVATTTTAATVADHLLQARVNLLLGLLQNVHQVTSLLGV